MKKILFSLLMVSIFIVSSCKNENSNPAIDVPEDGFVAIMDNASIQNAPKDDMSIKTTIDVQGGLYWYDDDRIAINECEYKTEISGEVGEQVAVFAPATAKKATEAPYVAFYPYSNWSEKSLGHNISFYVDEYGFVHASNVPLYAVSDNKELRFKSLVGVLMLQLPNTYGTTVFQKFVLTANKNICGTFKIETDETPLIDGTDGNTLYKATITSSSAENDSIIVTGTFKVNGTPIYMPIPAGEYSSLTINGYVKSTDVKPSFHKTASNVTITQHHRYTINL